VTTVRIAAAAAQFDRDPGRALERLEVVIGAAHYARATLLALPAATLTGPRPLAPDSAELRRVRRLAGSMVVCLGYRELDGGRPVSAAVCLHGDGLLGQYRQVHQRPSATETGAATGDRIEAFDTPLGRLGLLLDADKAYPEAARTLALDGARVVACLSAWPASATGRSTRLPQDRQSRLFDLYDCARAAENQVVWVSANQAGTQDGRRFLGQAKVVGPGGEILARTAAKAGLAVAELDVDASVAAARSEDDLLHGRRPELYRDK
jgi:predicted amidohydrolase